MTTDDFLWVILGMGFLTGIAYVRSEFHAYRARQGVERERLAQQRMLWPTKTQATAASPSKASKAISAAERTTPALDHRQRPDRYQCCSSGR
jgi:hypothetical protein